MSRYDLAKDHPVWLATGWMFAAIAAATTVIAFAPLDYERYHLLAFAGWCLLVALVVLSTSPPEVESRRNHLALATVWGSVALGLVAYAPHSVQVLVPVMFVGTLTASRLVAREQIVAHYLGASIAIATPVVLGLVDADTTLGAAAMIPCMWMLGACTVFVLEAAEAQGAELEQLVRRDPLTGVGNRRMITEQLADDLGRHTRAQRPLSLLMVDLTGFKQINDQFGHATGDELLRAVATALVRVTGRSGTVGRHAGDAFCVILPGHDPADAERFANAVRAALARVPWTSGHVTATCSIASYPRDAVHAGVLLHVADERLHAGNTGSTTIGERVEPAAEADTAHQQQPRQA